MRRALKGRRVVDVEIAQRHVEVTPHYQRLGAVSIAQPHPQVLEPAEFVGVMGIVDGAAIGDVARVKAESVTRRSNEARLDVVTQPALDIAQSDAREDRHAIPLSLTVVCRLETQVGQRREGELLVSLLGLLDQYHVGLMLEEPVVHTRPPRRQRIDVPGDNLHDASARMNKRSASAAT